MRGGGPGTPGRVIGRVKWVENCWGGGTNAQGVSFAALTIRGVCTGACDSLRTLSLRVDAQGVCSGVCDRWRTLVAQSFPSALQRLHNSAVCAQGRVAGGEYSCPSIFPSATERLSPFQVWG